MREFFYKYGLVIFLMITISVIAYQKETNEIIPNQHMVITVMLPGGYIPVIIKKGFLNKNNEGKTWITIKKFKELKKPKQKPRVDNRHTFEVNK